MPPPLALQAVEFKKGMIVFKNGLCLKCQRSINIWSKPAVRTVQRKIIVIL